jgi:putative membrane protein
MIAALAIACGSNNKQAQEPSSSMENTAAYNASQPQTSQAQQPTYQTTPQGPSMNTAGPQESALGNPNPQESTIGSGGAQDSTMGSGSAQKPFYGPGTTNPDETASTTTTNEGSMQAKTVTSLSDGEVLAIENALNNGEITLAERAKKSASNTQVKDFAAMMITQHRDALNKAKTVAKKNKITAQDNDVSNKLKSDASSTMTDLKDKKGHDFDTAYIDSQVKMHKDGLDLIDNQLLPSVKNGELKDQITTARRHVADHLSKAQDIQSRLQAVGTTSTTSGTMDTGTNKAKTGSDTGKVDHTKTKGQNHANDMKDTKDKKSPNETDHEDMKH